MNLPQPKLDIEKRESLYAKADWKDLIWHDELGYKHPDSLQNGVPLGSFPAWDHFCQVTFPYFADGALIGYWAGDDEGNWGKEPTYVTIKLWLMMNDGDPSWGNVHSFSIPFHLMPTPHYVVGDRMPPQVPDGETKAERFPYLVWPTDRNNCAEKPMDDSIIFPMRARPGKNTVNGKMYWYPEMIRMHDTDIYTQV